MNKSFYEIINYIRKLYNDPCGKIPLHSPIFTGNEKKYLEECIDSTYVSSVGEFVDRFEEKVAKYTGINKAVACVNGTSALYIALKLIGIDHNQEVITQPVTFVATVNAIAYCGARPIFLDVDHDTMGLSPRALLMFLESKTEQSQSLNRRINKLTKKPITACIPMHTFGHPCRIDEIVEICNNYGIPVVEDATESFGSFFKGQHTGTFGEVGVLSFNGNKILTTGGGGMLLFHNEILAKRAKHLTTQAKVPHPWEFVHDEIGYNFRMPNINAALGLAQIEQAEKFIILKRKLANEYETFFNSLKILFMKEPENARSNYWLNCILLKNKYERDEFLKYSNENGVMTRPVWRLMNYLPMFKNCETDDLKNSVVVAERLVNIPSSVRL